MLCVDAMRLSTCWLAVALLGCAGDKGIEDPKDASFLAGGKGDAFGIEDWSPDGAAVLNLATTASVDTLVDDVGLTQRAADGIIAQRAAVGGVFEDLAQLDDADWVGPASFEHMRQYVTDKKLFKTALRIPLVIDDGSGTSGKPISEYNQLAYSFGHTGFAKYTFIDGSVGYGAKAESYDMRLQALAAAAGVTIDGEMLRYAATLDEYGDVCFIGDPADVPELTAGQYDDLMGDMYSMWAWRAGTASYVEDPTLDPAQEYDGWAGYDTASRTVLMWTTADDDGDFLHSEVVPPCR
jgi:hypothetical protein